MKIVEVNVHPVVGSCNWDLTVLEAGETYSALYAESLEKAFITVAEDIQQAKRRKEENE